MWPLIRHLEEAQRASRPISLLRETTQVSSLSFSSLGHASLKIHILSHTKEAGFTCRVEGCERSFVYKRGLDNHVLHFHQAGDKPLLLCKICRKEFRDGLKLKQHEIYHSGLRSFMCELCSATFKTRKDLLGHVKLHEKQNSIKIPTPRKSRISGIQKEGDGGFVGSERDRDEQMEWFKEWKVNFNGVMDLRVEWKISSMTTYFHSPCDQSKPLFLTIFLFVYEYNSGICKLTTDWIKLWQNILLGLGGDRALIFYPFIQRGLWTWSAEANKLRQPKQSTLFYIFNILYKNENKTPVFIEFQ